MRVLLAPVSILSVCLLAVLAAAPAGGQSRELTSLPPLVRFTTVTTSAAVTSTAADAETLQSWIKKAFQIEIFAASVVPECDVATVSQRRKSFALPRKLQDRAPDAEDPLAQPSAGAPQQAAGAEDLAKQLANPIASLISMRFENNVDFNTGPEESGYRYTMNFVPVIPVALNKDWNMISRTLVPIIYQQDTAERGTSQTGLGDIVPSLFFSPNKAKPFIWGVGPVLLIPTATNERLGTGKFGLGPTAVVLKQQGKLTYGALWNHIWSVAGDNDRADVSSTFTQPFLAYTTKSAWTFLVNTESSYDWNAGKWSVPIHLVAQKLIKFGKQPYSIGGGLRCWATSPAGGPRGCGFRFIFTPLFPKG